LISDERYERFTEKVAQIESERKRLFKTIIKINDEVQAILKEANSTPLKDATRATELLKRPEVPYGMIERMTEEQDLHPEDKEQVEIQIKYEGYIKKSNKQDAKMLKMEDKKITVDIDYEEVQSIAYEAREKLKKIRTISTRQN